MNRLLMAALAAASGCTLALAGPADPQAATPVPAYQPVFPAPAPSPDALGWRDANDAVGRFPRGHIDLLQWEARQPRPPQTPNPPAAAPLSLERALALAWARDPQGFTTPGMSAAERAHLQSRALAVQHEVRAAWFSAVAAQAAQRAQQAQWDNADTGAELAQRMQRVGNWSSAQAARERLQRAEAGAELVRARQEAISARERLVRLIGLWGAEAQLVLPDSLPPLPAQPMTADGLEAQALSRHPALALLRSEAERQAAAVDAQALQQARQTLATVADRAAAPDAAGAAALHLDLRQLPGWSHELERALRAQARADALAVEIRSQVRDSWHQLRAAHELAQATERETVALTELLRQDGQQRYNGMLASTWDLLAVSRQHGQARRAALLAQLDYWLAHNNLDAVLAGGEPVGGATLRRASGGSTAAQGH